MWDPRKIDGFMLIFLSLEIGILVTYGLFSNYGELVSSSGIADNGAIVEEIYPLFQDVHVMIFVGFGFLMAFMRMGSFSAVSLTLLVGAFSMQYGILCVGFFHRLWDEDFSQKISLSIESLVTGDFSAAAVLISFGVLIGKVSPTQVMIMALIEIPLYAFNEVIMVKYLEIEDIGGSIIIHMFGAYFGVGASLFIRPKNFKHRRNHHASVYHSDVFAMIGTLFLWMYWPSFNAVLAGNDLNKRHRVIVNTVLSMTTSAVFTFITSRMIRGKKKFDMADIQNATLAGGVGIGAAAGMTAVNPWSALLIGAISGVVSTAGYAKGQQFLEDKLGLHDTCGVHNLHGMPSIVAAFASAAVASEQPSDVVAGRDGTTQAEKQLLGMAITLGMSLVGGMITAMVMQFFNPSPSKELFSDAYYFFVPEEEIPEYHSPKKSKRRVADEEEAFGFPSHDNSPTKSFGAPTGMMTRMSGTLGNM